MTKSYIGEPYLGSKRRARIYTSVTAATKALKRKKKRGKVYQIGKGRLFVVKERGKKYYSK